MLNLVAYDYLIISNKLVFFFFFLRLVTHLLIMFMDMLHNYTNT